MVSGFARGIDRAAHQGSLRTGTAAILAAGLADKMPRESHKLAEEICAEGGCIVSESPIGAPPQPYDFLHRNRIVVALGEVLLVVEAELKSGSLHAAGCALDLGKDVLAVPGAPNNSLAAGCNQLIRDGAILARHSEDVLEMLSSPEREIKIQVDRSEPPTNELVGAILECLEDQPMSRQAIVETIEASPKEITSLLTELELSGQIDTDGQGDFHIT